MSDIELLVRNLSGVHFREDNYNWITIREDTLVQVIEEIIKGKEVSVINEVDLEKYYHDFLQKEWFDKNCNRTISEMMAFTAKHFFELGLKAQKGE